MENDPAKIQRTPVYCHHVQLLEGETSTEWQIYEGNLHIHVVIYNDVKRYRMNCQSIGQKSALEP